ncbi:AMP-binding protein [Chlamydia gallinacea]|uniref:Long-chain fatty acid--CoA ligase n=2 Tax=Chlamydia gallinacea TaxID=1457153 RepID=A0A173DYA4_9CHLA|nr:AMP-binding protein [Chlamydia gallinacea]EYE60777.1 AMP-binding enzyme family protein [Bacteroides fragilis str. S6L5]ANG65912.1 long-chain fatty acid--CoA ligase [Chlamydia gallinacea 08-1274/3]AQT77851.1 long-chain fatty acid--CoA ligase [Chlamydia gallinacea]MBX6680563.1 AMP-binding protein [Chlamydia gallinacea]MBX6687409.1 AMP-binding protein [Chlamydia gallinacea]
MHAWHLSDKQRIKLREGDTVLERFLAVCSELTSNAICWDEQLGVLSYDTMLKAVVALALKISRYPDKCIGVMMPASAGAFIAYFAILLAGKIPVMVNWSQGIKEMQACLDLAEVHYILTSKQLVGRLRQLHGDATHYPAELIYMEDIRKKLSFWDKLRTALYVSLPFHWLMRIFGVLTQTSEDIAVILFTSGTENTPKGVPLSHGNLLANLKACLFFFDPVETDIMLSFLPPFHAYGFNCSSLFPILTGVPVVFSYNPLQPKKVVRNIERMQVTFFCSTPVFFDYLIKTAKKSRSSLKSLRFVVLGGDTFKDSLRERVKKDFPHVVLRQGYGTTECSPVVTINDTKSPEKASCVGVPIDGMDVLIISEDTHVPVSSGEVGLVVIRGTSLFSGYLHADPHYGFISLGGEDWYVTGDLGYVDTRGELFLQGRLSRFVKIGGEMISLGAVESLLLQGFGISQDQEGAALIVCEVPHGKGKLCLFTTFPTTCSEANHILKNLKTSSIMKVSYHYELESIPMLGTGKPDYRKLNSLADTLFKKKTEK